MLKNLLLISLFCTSLFASEPKVQVGAEQLFTPKYVNYLQGKSIGLITNHTAVDRSLVSTYKNLLEHQKRHRFKIVAVFSPEHGINGSHSSEKLTGDSKTDEGIPIFSLYGKTKRPTTEMLEGINLLVYDIQDIGSRSYTYITTLFYVMEEAAKANIPVLVLDRPNPINGRVVDGPMMEERFRSFVGYINVPYCHGMTVMELARLFNGEYHIGCNLYTLPMVGWKRSMTFLDTGLPWIPTSPNIPEPTTPLHYPTTGILGELSIASIGIGSTLPFKVVGAPWMQADRFASELQKQHLPGVLFKPYFFKPQTGLYAGVECAGVLIVVTDPLTYKPVATQYTILGIMKALYPKEFSEALSKSKHRQEMFGKINGTDKAWFTISQQRNIVWKLRGIHEKETKDFASVRQKYLHPDYGQ